VSRLLLVEDDRGLAAGLAAALRRDGSQVDVADCGREALRLARAASYDACILDLGLPDRDGVDVLREMRATAIGFPVLVLTARDALGERIRGLDAGADDYLVELTRREAAVLECLMRRPGRIVAKEAILAAAFPSDSEAAPNAVEVQVSRLRRKLEAAGVTVRALRGLGYRLEESGGHALE
jgi:DNA-binding response OmpR family regulator